jgi:xanthosine utilization system XapX-like protein
MLWLNSRQLRKAWFGKASESLNNSDLENLAYGILVVICYALFMLLTPSDYPKDGAVLSAVIGALGYIIGRRLRKAKH